jgi:hypothetical protein
MTKFTANKSCVINVGTIPGLNSEAGGSLYLNRGEALIAPDGTPNPAPTHLDESVPTANDLSWGTNHLTADQATRGYK